MTVMIHGEEAYEQAIRLSQALFSGKVAELTKEEIAMGFEGIPQIEISEPIGLIDALVLVKAASSKREARDFINGGGVSINGNQQKDMNFVITDECTIGEEYTIIRRGKKNYYVIKHVK
jgi:tyrosyl-tRNA synthetase